MNFVWNDTNNVGSESNYQNESLEFYIILDFETPGILKKKTENYITSNT